ncbi:MAG: histidine phosphatase family protein [Rhodospirillales bacterium]|nr:histidine phosphatase family protein [Rhodospirillales bacterium]
MGRLYGQTDLACDTSDTAALKALAAMLPKGALWVVSHLRRTAETARAIATNGLDAAPPIVEPDLAEQHFGAWQGMTWDEIRAADEEASQEFWQDPTGNAPPGGESFAHMVARAGAVIERLTAANGGRDIISVAHAGSIRAALALALDLDAGKGLAVQIDNLSVTRVEHVAERLDMGHASAWRVVTVNRPPG